MRRLHHRVREWLHLRVCHWGKWAWRDQHDDTREDDQRKDNQYNMRRKTDSSCHIRRSLEKVIDPAGHDILCAQRKSDEWKETIEENNIEAEATLEMSLRLLEEWKRMNKWTHMNQNKTGRKRGSWRKGKKERWRNQTTTRCTWEEIYWKHSKDQMTKKWKAT